MIASQERKLSEEKRGEEVFRSKSHGSLLFGKEKETFGVDAQAEALLKQKKVFTNSVPRKFAHESSFKPIRRGHGDPIGAYPAFIIPESKSEQPKSVRKEKS